MGQEKKEFKEQENHGHVHGQGHSHGQDFGSHP